MFNSRSNVGFPDFNCYRVDRPHGGVALYIHKSIPQNFLRKESLDFAEAVSVKIHCSDGDITLTSIYCSPAASRKQSVEFFSNIFALSGSCIVAGDFNAKHTAWNNLSHTLKGTDIFNLCSKNNFFIHSPDGPTIIPPVGEPSALDFVISKAIRGVTDPIVINDLSSDHFPLSFSIPFDTSVLKNLEIFNFRKADWKKFKSKLIFSSFELNEKFPVLNTPQLIEDCISKLEETVHKAMKESILKKLPYKFRYPYSDEVHRLTKERNYYRNQFLKSGNPAFRSLKKQLDQLIRQKVYQINNESFENKMA